MWNITNLTLTLNLQNKVASFKRSQCEGCSIIIYLMALYDYYLKCIEGRHIKDILNRLFESNPVDEVSKLMKSLTDFYDVTFNFYDQKKQKLV